MDIVNPDPSTFVLPDGSEVTTFAEHQQDKYQRLPAIRTPDGRVISQWRPSPEELQQLFAGQPITLCVSTFNHPDGLQPVWVGVGGYDVREP